MSDVSQILDALAAGRLLPLVYDELPALDKALTRLEAADPEAAAVVQLRYFAGLSVEGAAWSLGVSRAAAYRLWTFARACLLREPGGEDST